VIPLAVRRVVLGLLPALPLALQAQSPPPATPRREVVDTYFGTAVADPYRWMEAPSAKNPEFRAWLETQNAYTQEVLDRIPGRAALQERTRALLDAVTSVTQADRMGGRWFYFKTPPGAESRKLYVREGRGPEQMLLDPDTLPAPAGSHYAIDYQFPSPDGRLVAYGLSLGGSERTVLRIMEVPGGRVLPDSITRAQFPVVNWAEDSRSFHYNRLNAAGDTNPGARYQRSAAFRHVVGRPVDQDLELLGPGNPAVPLEPDDFPVILDYPGTPHLFAIVFRGVKPEITVYLRPRGAPSGTARWRKLVDPDDAVTNFAARGEDVFLLTHTGAPRFQVVRVKATDRDLSGAVAVVPPGPVVVQNLGMAKDALYVLKLDGGLARVSRIPPGGGSEDLALPYPGAIDFFVTDARRPGVLFRLQSWTRPAQWYQYDPASKRVKNTGLVPPATGADFSRIETVETEAPAADGVKIPLSIVHTRGIPLDGSHPTLLEGYGAYGYSFDPFFNTMLLAWLERGGIYAVAHVRGGGEYGEEWHLAGKMETKPNTWRDLIACAEHLVAKGYTSPAHLSGSGTSAGGILIGRAITERPDLFRAAVPRVGVMNALRGEHEPSGPANIPEFGTAADQAGFRALWEMDALHHVKPGEKYPAVLLTAGIHDSRVEAWQPAKMAAALRERSASGNPVLLRVDFDAGHGMGLTKSQRSAEWADIYGFLLWQLGSPGFQLTP